jgi:uncharacterized integral membrane protein
MLLFFIITALIIAILAIIFALQNASIIVISFLAWQFQGSPAMILLLAFVLGSTVSLLLVLPKLVKGSFTISGQKKKIEELQKELESKRKEEATEQKGEDKQYNYEQRK